MIYFLLHNNIKLATFEVIDNIITKIAINRSESVKRYLPLGVKDGKSLKLWLLNRGVPVTRHGLSRELKELKAINPFELMLRNYGLSLTDHYWVQPIDAEYTWENIDLYTNDFKAAYSLNLSDDKSSIDGKSNFVPSASLKGDLQKKWIIDSAGNRILVKGNYGSTCRQSLSERLASEIHKRQNKFPYVQYKLIEISSDKNLILGCGCKNFTSISTEFIPAIDIVDAYKKPNDISYYEFYLKLCKEQGIDIRSFMEYQILTDFIISNTDRHLNNFGILRDSESMQFIGMAPIFDSGNSMFYKSTYIPVGKSLLEIEVTSFLKQEVGLLRYITDRSLLNTSLLPSDTEVYELLAKDENVKEETNERIVRAYNKKISFMNDFQNGADIWSYNYSKNIR